MMDSMGTKVDILQCLAIKHGIPTSNKEICMEVRHIGNQEGSLMCIVI